MGLIFFGFILVDWINKNMDENVLGLIAGGLTSVAMMPQLIKVLKEKNAEDISILMLLVLISGLSLWVWYGIFCKTNYRLFYLMDFQFWSI